MKNIIRYSTLLTISVSFLFISCSFVGVNKNYEKDINGSAIIDGLNITLNDSGETSTKTYDVTGFKSIKTNIPCKINYVMGPESLSISATETVFSHLSVVVVDSVLVIETRGVKIRNQRSNRIEVSSPMLSGLTVNGAADFNSDRIVADDFTCNINGAGDVYINSLEAKDVSMEVNGAGDLDVEHFTCEEAYVEINGAGDLAVEDLDCNNIRIEVNGAGDVSLSGKARTARVDITGAGDVKASSLECDDFVKTVNGKIRSK